MGLGVTSVKEHAAGAAPEASQTRQTHAASSGHPFCGWLTASSGGEGVADGDMGLGVPSVPPVSLRNCTRFTS